MSNIQTASTALTIYDPAWRTQTFNWLLNFTSRNTRKTYHHHLQQFTRWLHSNNIQIEETSRTHIIAYREHLTNRDLTAATINNHLAAISSFFKAMQQANLIAINPTDNIKRLAVSPYGKAQWLDYHNNEDERRLAAIDRSDEIGRRAYAMLRLMLVTGIRAAVISKLRTTDLRRQGDRVFMTYTNKGGETVRKRLPAGVIEAITDYLMHRNWNGADEPLFTVTEQGRAIMERTGHAREDRTGISYATVRRIVRKYFDINPHALRHTGAGKLYSAGASLRDLQDWTRHKSLSSLSIYLQSISGQGDSLSEQLDNDYD